MRQPLNQLVELNLLLPLKARLLDSILPANNPDILLFLSLDLQCQPTPPQTRAAALARLRHELEFLLSQILFENTQDLAHCLNLYLLSDGLRTRLPNRLQIEQLAGRLIQQDSCSEKHLDEWQCSRKKVSITTEVSDFGMVDIVYEGLQVGLYRLYILPQKSIPAHYHQQMLESELILSDGLLLQGQPVPSGLVLNWPKGYIHSYTNVSPSTQVVLCIDCPAFIRNDEIVVTTAASELVPLSPSFTKKLWS